MSSVELLFMHNAQCMMHDLDRKGGAGKVAFCFNS